MLDAEVANFCTAVFQNFISHEGIYLKDKAYVYFGGKYCPRYKFTWFYAKEDNEAKFTIEEEEKLLYQWSFTEHFWHYDGAQKEELLHFMKKALCDGVFYNLEV